jgi:hypothetical protein
MTYATDRAARVRTALVLTFWFMHPAAFACTVCHTATAQEVRAAVFGPDFCENLTASVLPVAFVGVLALYIRDGGTRK